MTARGRKNDYRISNVTDRRRSSLGVMKYVATERQRASNRTRIRCTETLILFASRFQNERKEETVRLNLRELIFAIDFSFNFNHFTEVDCLIKFWFTKSDIDHLIPVLAWTLNKTHTKRNRYGTSPILSACVVLRRLAAPARWTDCIRLFGKWKAHLLEYVLEPQRLEDMLESKFF